MGRWLCRAGFKAAQHVSVALAGSYQHGSSPTRHKLLKSHTNFNKMTAGGTRGGCTKGLCVLTAPLDTLKRKKPVPILASLPRMAGLGGQQGRGGAAGRGTSLCPAAASPALPTHQHTHVCHCVCPNTWHCPCQQLQPAWKGPQRAHRALGTAGSTSDRQDELPEPAAAFGRTKSPQDVGHAAFPTVTVTAFIPLALLSTEPQLLSTKN